LFSYFPLFFINPIEDLENKNLSYLNLSVDIESGVGKVLLILNRWGNTPKYWGIRESPF